MSITPAFLRLEPDQVLGASFIQSRPVTMLGDIPGLGKTAQAIHAFDCSGSSVGLVICPPILCKNWAREFEMWSFVGHTVTVLKSGKDTIPLDGVVVLSYDIANQAHVRKQLMKRGGDWLFLDEAHRLKESTSKRFKSIFLAEGIAKNFKRVTWLTGTPCPNGGHELYTFLKTSGQWPGNRSAFLSRYFKTIDETTYTSFGPIIKLKVVGNKDPEGLRELLAPVFLRRTEIRGLPKLTTDVVAIEGSDAHRKTLEKYVTPEVLAEIDNAIESANWQFFDTPHIASIRKLTGVAKAQEAADYIISQLDDGEPNIVAFALHTAVIDIVAERIASRNYSVSILDGRTPRDGVRVTPRQNMIDAFQAGKIDVLLCHSVAAGEGLTLTRSKRVIIIEPSWTPKDNDQPIARCWRKGQMHECRATFLTLDQSLDDTVFATLNRKAAFIAEIV